LEAEILCSISPAEETTFIFFALLMIKWMDGKQNASTGTFIGSGSTFAAPTNAWVEWNFHSSLG
jgi:hypothetical protein